MLLNPAVEADYAAIIDLVNVAFRGSGPSASWNIETGIIEGQRLNESLLREDLAAKLPLSFEACESTVFTMCNRLLASPCGRELFDG